MPEEPTKTPEETPAIEQPTVEPTSEVSKQPEQKKSKMNPFLILMSVLGIITLISITVAGGAYVAQQFTPNASPSLTTADDGNSTVTQEESSIAAVAEKVGPSVVSIVTQATTTSYFGGSSSSEAAGTGVIVSKDGYVMTNNHVVESASSVSVVDSTGEVYKDVTIIGRDPLNDIAFLKIKSDTEFTPAELGNSSTIRTGQQVVAIGNALGQYSNTVTSGIISGVGRSVTATSEADGTTESLSDLIQTDASINPGNSGGALVNLAGQVIGINTAVAQDSDGIGFAIPINSTKGVLAGVLENGKVSRAFLGVSYITVTPAIADEYDLSVKSGAYVHATGTSNAVSSGSPADAAGIEDGDVIVKINNETVGEQGSLSSILGEYRPGDKITITYVRDGKEHTTTATLTEYKG